jgi:hypothetical protein
MGLLKALHATFNQRARAEHNLETFVHLFRSLNRPNTPPVIPLYDMYMKMTSLGMVKEWARTPPVVNNIIALYSCLTPPNCALALAHQFNITEGNKLYKDPADELPLEFKRAMKEIITPEGDIDIFTCVDKFLINNGKETVTHPDNLLNFSISTTTSLAVFMEWNRTDNINEMLI